MLWSIPVQNITARLTPNPAEPPVNATVREAKAVMESLPPTRNQLEIHIDNTSSKLNRIRDLVASIPLALHLVNDSFITVTPSRRTIEDPFTNEISLDIKTNNSDGMLLYMVEDQNNLTLGRSGEVVSAFMLLFNIFQGNKRIFNSFISQLVDRKISSRTARHRLMSSDILACSSWPHHH